MDFIVYHSKDLDGKASGVTLHKQFPNAVTVPYHYKEDFIELEKLKGLDMIMADVTLPAQNLIEVAKVLQSFILIDHHISAKEEILNYLTANEIEFEESDFNGLVKEYYAQSLNFHFYYSDILSACEICFLLYPFGTSVTKEKIRLLGQYDTWRNNGKELVSDYKWDEQVLPFQMGSRVYDRLRDLENFLFEDNINGTILSGKGILNYQENINFSIMANNAFVVLINGIRFLACNGIIPNSNSFKGFYMEELHDAMMAFQYSGVNKKWNFSLYTTLDNVDILSLAKNFGGGGHSKACGFSLEEHEFQMRDNFLYLGTPFIVDIANIPEGINTEEFLKSHLENNNIVETDTNKLFEENELEELTKEEVVVQEQKKVVPPKSTTKAKKKVVTKKAANGKSSKPGPKPKS